jgi:methyl-accepting chemotaxis protein
MSVRLKLLLGFGLILSITLGIVWLGQATLATTLIRIDTLLGVYAIDSQLLQARQQEKNYLIRSGDDYLNQALALADQVRQGAETSEGRMQLEENRLLMRDVLTEVAGYSEELAELKRTTDTMQASERAMDMAAQRVLKQFEEIATRIWDDSIAQIRETGEVSALQELELSNLANGFVKELLETQRIERDLTRGIGEQNAEQLQTHFELLDSMGKRLASEIADPQTREEIGTAMAQLADYQAQYRALRVAIAERDATVQDMTTRARQVADASARSVELQKQLLLSEAERARGLLLVAAVVALLLGVIAALSTTQSIVGPLRQVVSMARQMAAGDLSVDLQSAREDELGLLMRAMQEMVKSLRSLLGQLGQGTTQLAAAAQGLSVVTEQTSQGVTRQRLETEQVATAMNEMSATAQDVARNAELAAKSAHEADRQTQQGGQTVQQAVMGIEGLALSIAESAEAIERLKQDSTNIGAVLDVIKGIAEQTNLLALNAAIEAARAGESGRGFAVVADEVRALARRTQDSTQQIAQLVGSLQGGAGRAVSVMAHSCSLAQDAVSVARSAGQALSEIGQSVSLIQQMNQQIATAAEQQSAVAEEINRSVASIRQVSEQSDLATQQTSMASSDLASLGESLQGQVRRFRLT